MQGEQRNDKQTSTTRKRHKHAMRTSKPPSTTSQHPRKRTNKNQRTIRKKPTTCQRIQPKNTQHCCVL